MVELKKLMIGLNGSSFHCDRDQHACACDHNDGVPGNSCNGFFLRCQLHKQCDHCKDDGYQSYIDLTGDHFDHFVSGHEELEQREDQHDDHHGDHQSEGCLLDLCECLRLLKLYSLADVAVGFESKAHDRDQNYREQNCEQENQHFGLELRS